MKVNSEMLSTAIEEYQKKGLIRSIIEQVIIGTIGPGSSKEARQWCASDLQKQDYRLWHFSLNHYREIYGYKKQEVNIQIGLFPLVNC